MLVQPARAPGSTTSTSSTVAEANLTPSPARLTRIREWLARTRLKERLTNARDAGSRRVTHGVYVLRASPRVMNDGRSHPDEAAAPSTSRYLTRVHDAESLEDLKPWRTRGIELFTGDDYLHSAGGALRGWDHLPLRSALHRPRPLGMPPTATRSPSLLLFPPPRASTPPSFDPSSRRGPTTLRPRRIRPVSPSRRRCERRSVHPPRPATRRSRSTPRRERPSRRRSPPRALHGGCRRRRRRRARRGHRDESGRGGRRRGGGDGAFRRNIRVLFRRRREAAADPSSSTTTNDVSVRRTTAHDHAPESTSTHVAPVTTPEKTSKNSRRVFADANAAARSSSSSASPPRAGTISGSSVARARWWRRPCGTLGRARAATRRRVPWTPRFARVYARSGRRRRTRRTARRRREDGETRSRSSRRITERHPRRSLSPRRRRSRVDGTSTCRLPWSPRCTSDVRRRCPRLRLDARPARRRRTRECPRSSFPSLRFRCARFSRRPAGRMPRRRRRRFAR